MGDKNKTLADYIESNLYQGAVPNSGEVSVYAAGGVANFVEEFGQNQNDPYPVLWFCRTMKERMDEHPEKSDKYKALYSAAILVLVDYNMNEGAPIPLEHLHMLEEKEWVKKDFRATVEDVANGEVPEYMEAGDDVWVLSEAGEAAAILAKQVIHYGLLEKELLDGGAC